MLCSMRADQAHDSLGNLSGIYSQGQIQVSKITGISETPTVLVWS